MQDRSLFRFVFFVVMCGALTFAGFGSGSIALAGPADDETSAGMKTAIKPLAYVDASEFQNVLELLEVEYVVQPSMNAVILKGKPANVESALRAIEALDVPAPNLGLTMYIVAASKEAGGSSDVPEDLEPVVEQLSGVFGYSSFQLLDAVSLSVRSGSGGLVHGGFLLQDGSGLSVGYEISFSAAQIALSGDSSESWAVRLDKLGFRLRTDGKLIAQIQTEIKVREGQKAVVGRSTPEGIGDNVVLIVDARVVRNGS